MSYKGSKNKIAKDIVDLLPAADTFIDLFAGGCAVTHAALLSGKYKKVIANDIQGTAILFDDIVHGRKKISYDWVSREDFFECKDTDLVTAICWSFGNNMRDYIYSKDKEEARRKAHEWCIAEGKEHTRERYLQYKKTLREKGIKRRDLSGIESLERLYRLQSIERLERLEGLEWLEGLERLEGLGKDYRDVQIPTGGGGKRLYIVTRPIKTQIHTMV